MIEPQVETRAAGGDFDDHKFDVFISYSRRDSAFARRLYRALTGYTPPRDLPVPARRLRVFLDETDFQGTEYNAALGEMLQSAAKLLVICSPASRSSRYVGDEIARFAALRGSEHIVSVLLAGRPNNEASPADEPAAFHDELVSRLPVPLAVEYRGWDEQRDRVERGRFEGSWHKLLADIYVGYGVDRSAIEQREKRRQQRTRRIWTGFVSALVAVLASLTIWALISRQEAIAQRNTAQSRFLASQSLSGAHTFDVAMLLAAAAQRTAPTFEAWEALFVGLQRQPALERFLHGLETPAERVVVGRNGTCAAASSEGRQTAGGDGQQARPWRTLIWDFSTGRRRLTVDAEARPDPSCASVVVVSDDGRIDRRPIDGSDTRLWSVTDTAGRPGAWTVDSNGTQLAVVGSQRLVIRDMADGRIRGELAAPATALAGLRFSADGRALAGIDRLGMVHRWHTDPLAPMSPAVRCGTQQGDVYAIGPDLRWCAAGGPGLLVLADLTVAAGGEIDLGTPWILALDFSPDGRTLMAGVQGGELQFWKIEDAQRNQVRSRPAAWAEHRSDVTAAAYSADGHTILSSARDRSLIVWRTDSTSRLVSDALRPSGSRVVAPDAAAERVAIGTPAGDLLISPLPAGSSADTGAANVVHVANVGKQVTAVALRANGEILAGTADGTVLGVTAQARRAFTGGPAKPIVRIRLDRAESRVAAVTENGVVTVWDLASGTSIGTFAGGKPRRERGGGITPGVDAAFEPGGTRLVSVHGDQQAFLWDRDANGPRFSPLPFRPTSYFTSVALAADGKTIALGTGMYEGEVVLLDASNPGAPATRLPGHQQQDVTGLAFSPDGRLLFSSGFDRRVAVWDVGGRRRIGDVFRLNDAIDGLAYAANAAAVTAITDRGGVLRWTLDVSRWVEMACRVASRELSPEERARFGAARSACGTE